jgi:hypothetical protein
VWFDGAYFTGLRRQFVDKIMTRHCPNCSMSIIGQNDTIRDYLRSGSMPADPRVQADRHLGADPLIQADRHLEADSLIQADRHLQADTQVLADQHVHDGADRASGSM